MPFCAFSQVNTCPTYTIPEVRVKKIQFFVTPESKIEELNLKKLSIKEKITPTLVTEYDINGNIVKETQNSDYQMITKCTYTKGVLTERQSLYITDKNKTEAANQKAQREAEIELKRDGMTSIAYANPNNTERLYTATINDKNQVTSYRSQEFEFNGKNKKLTSDQKTDITYQNGKISTVKSPNSSEQYYYQNNILVKKEQQTTDKFQGDKKVVEEFLYDQNKNLIGIQYQEEAIRNGESMGKSSGIKDPVMYDQKNRIIRFGGKEQFTQYTYDNIGNMTSITDFYKDKEVKKIEFSYQKNNIIKIVETSGIQKYYTDYIYKNSLMTEMKTYSDKTPILSKMVFEYNNKNQLTKVSRLSPVYDREKGLLENKFTTASETEYVYDGKFVIMKNQGKEALRYKLY
ncbi:hypothetical protein DBR39_15395 [Chryseobacterium sp. KBW03]|nr:hypothetical protein DBR39_15395 [Chryseobacterium sp. KBW03]